MSHGWRWGHVGTLTTGTATGQTLVARHHQWRVTSHKGCDWQSMTMWAQAVQPLLCSSLASKQLNKSPLHPIAADACPWHMPWPPPHSEGARVWTQAAAPRSVPPRLRRATPPLPRVPPVSAGLAWRTSRPQAKPLLRLNTHSMRRSSWALDQALPGIHPSARRRTAADSHTRCCDQVPQAPRMSCMLQSPRLGAGITMWRARMVWPVPQVAALPQIPPGGHGFFKARTSHGLRPRSPRTPYLFLSGGAWITAASTNHEHAMQGAIIRSRRDSCCWHCLRGSTRH